VRARERRVLNELDGLEADRFHEDGTDHAERAIDARATEIDRVREEDRVLGRCPECIEPRIPNRDRNADAAELRLPGQHLGRAVLAAALVQPPLKQGELRRAQPQVVQSRRRRGLAEVERAADDDVFELDRLFLAQRFEHNAGVTALAPGCDGCGDRIGDRGVTDDETAGLAALAGVLGLLPGGDGFPEDRVRPARRVKVADSVAEGHAAARRERRRQDDENNDKAKTAQHRNYHFEGGSIGARGGPTQAPGWLRRQ
jgi:hypothetical protein